MRCQSKPWEYVAGPNGADTALPLSLFVLQRLLALEGIKAWSVFQGPCDLSYKLTLSQMQCLQRHSVTYISHHRCPKLLTSSKITSLWSFHSIWEHPLSQTLAVQGTSHNTAGHGVLCTDLESYRTAISWHRSRIFAFSFIRTSKKTLCLSTVRP